MRIKRQLNGAARCLLGCCLALLLGLYGFGARVCAAEPSRGLFEETSGEPAESADTGDTPGAGSEEAVGALPPGTSDAVPDGAGAAGGGAEVPPEEAVGSSEAAPSTDTAEPPSSAAESAFTGYGGGGTSSAVSSAAISSQLEIPAVAVPPPQEEAPGPGVWIVLITALLLLLIDGGLFFLILRSNFLLRKSVNELKKEQKRINGSVGQLSEALMMLSLRERGQRREETASQPQDGRGDTRFPSDFMRESTAKPPAISTLRPQPDDEEELKQMLSTISQYYHKQTFAKSEQEAGVTFWEIDQEEVVRLQFSDAETKQRDIAKVRFVATSSNEKNANFILVSQGSYHYMFPNWLKYHGDNAVIRRELIDQNVKWYFDFEQKGQKISLIKGYEYRIEGISKVAVVRPPSGNYCELKLKGCIEVSVIE